MGSGKCFSGYLGTCQRGKMEKRGVIESLEGSTGKSKVYRITDAGLVAFKEFKETWKQTIDYLCKNISS